MASVAKLALQSGAITASVTSDSKSLEPNYKKFIGWLDVSACDAATTVAAKIQHSPDKTNWIDFCTFTNVVGAAGRQAIHETSFATASQGLFPNIRSVVTLSGVTLSATVAVELYFDPDKR